MSSTDDSAPPVANTVCRARRPRRAAACTSCVRRLASDGKLAVPTIAPDIGAIAEQAVGLLAGHADERAPTELVTPFSLRVRASTGTADGRR